MWIIDLLYNIKKPIPREDKYHDFIDNKSIFNIENGLNVISNLALLLPVFYFYSKSNKFSFLYINIILLSFTSIYYHLNPNKDSIIYDMIFVVGTHTAAIMYLLNKDIKNYIYILGIYSVYYAYIYDDRRLYELIKYSSSIYFIYHIYINKRLSNYSYLLILFYLIQDYVAKYDKYIYNITNQIISGHTLKHIIGSINIFIVIYLLNNYLI